MNPARYLSQRFLAGLGLLLLTLVVAACGQSGPTTPQAPTASGFAPAAAARGETITVTGTNFGANPGSLTIGGATATVSSWGATSIVATVPEGAPNAWQQVTVTTAGGTATANNNLFVGVAYTGTGEGLPQFLDDQTAGTAVLLAARTYEINIDADDDILAIDNIDLYGRGMNQTSIVLPATLAGVVLANYGSTTTIADMSISGVLALLSGTLADTYLLPVSLDSAAAPKLPEELTAESIQQFSQQVNIEQLSAFAAPTVAMRNVEVGPDANLVTSFAVASPLSLEFYDSKIDQGILNLGLVVFGDLVLDNTSVAAEGAELVSIAGSLSIINSEIEAEYAALVGGQGVSIEGSEISATNGEIFVLAEVGLLPYGGPIYVGQSSLRAWDADLTDADQRGDIRFETALAPITLENNPLISAHSEIGLHTYGSMFGEGDIRLLNNPLIEVGISSTDDPVDFRRGELYISTSSNNLPDQIQIENNHFVVTYEIYIEDNGPADILFNQNTGVVGDPETRGWLELYASAGGAIQMTGNDMQVFGDVNAYADFAVGRPLTFTDNVITMTLVNDAGINLVSEGGNCNISGNTITSIDPTETYYTGAYFACYGGEGSHTLDITDNTITVHANGTARLEIGANELEAVTISQNTLSFGDFFMGLGAEEVSVTNNTISAGRGGMGIDGRYDSGVGRLNVSDNTVTLRDGASYGLMVFDVDNAQVTNNTFTQQGTPDPDSVAFTAGSMETNMQLVATNNTFTNFVHALDIVSHATNLPDLTFEITNNVFDFTINAAPQAALVHNVKDVINAQNNVWGQNTSADDVAGYVTLSGVTEAQGGSIVVAPITQP